jgi:hypothetical protein
MLEYSLFYKSSSVAYLSSCGCTREWQSVRLRWQTRPGRFPPLSRWKRQREWLAGCQAARCQSRGNRVMSSSLQPCWFLFKQYLDYLSSFLLFLQEIKNKMPYCSSVGKKWPWPPSAGVLEPKFAGPSKPIRQVKAWVRAGRCSIERDLCTIQDGEREKRWNELVKDFLCTTANVRR